MKSMGSFSPRYSTQKAALGTSLPLEMICTSIVFRSRLLRLTLFERNSPELSDLRLELTTPPLFIKFIKNTPLVSGLCIL